MLNLFSSGKTPNPQKFITEALSCILEEGGFLLSFQVGKEENNSFKVDIFGEDEGLLKIKKGRLLQALQTYLFQALQTEFPEEKFQVFVDSNGFWEEAEDRLMILTDQLKEKALDSKRPVFFKQALSALERRLVHERVSGNTGVRSQSFGNGLYKKMKLIPDSFNSDEK